MYTGPHITTNGLILNVDSSNTKSYNGTTTWYDLSGKGNNGTLNGQTFNSTYKGGIIFNGSNNISFGTNNNNFKFGLGSFSISSWFNPENGGSPALFGTGANIDSSRYALGFVYQLNSNIPNVFAFVKDNSNNQVQFNSSISLSLNTPFNAVMVVDRMSYVSLYINGNLVGRLSSTPLVGLVSPQGQTTIGSVVNGGGPNFSGTIYNTLVYNVPLTHSEVLQNYNAKRSMFGI